MKSKKLVVFRKQVDQSLLKSGLTIPAEYQQTLLSALDLSLNKGDKQAVKVTIQGAIYDATLNYVNLSSNYSERTIFQIRYAEGSPICTALKTIFSYSYREIDAIASNKEGKSKISIEDEYIDVVVNDDKQLEFVCHTKEMSSNELARFLTYIGDEHDLSGYQRSYKLVFYKCFFENENNGSIPEERLAKLFKAFYVQRQHDGKITDKDVDKTIADPSNASDTSVLALIIRNPYNAISKQGYFREEVIEGEKCFSLSDVLKQEVNTQDKEQIKNLVNKKLLYYYSKIDGTTTKDGKMREVIDRFLNEYITAKEQQFAGNSFGTFVRNDIPNAIYDTGIVDKEKYLITGSVGQGNWAMVPWVCIFDKRITTSATKGIYIVYLLSKDGKTLYLTFNQGCTEIRSNHSKRETIKIMRDRAIEIIEKIDARGFATDEDINLGDRLTELGEMYQKGTIFYTKYEQGNVPSENILQSDLKKMMEIYKEYVDGPIESEIDESGVPVGGGDNMSVKYKVESIKNYIQANGFTYPDGMIENFYLSLKSKPFVILAGTSGTGKTKLVSLFAEAIGAKMQLVPVRPDWSDSSDLFGHVDLSGNFVPGEIIDFVKEASEDIDTPYILCLDEMNLARVEYYLSDFLSVIETRRFEDDKIVTNNLLAKEKYGVGNGAYEHYGDLYLPENLYIVGTVNMDETTFPFSKKVLDRANTIEFSYVDLAPDFTCYNESPEILDLDNSFLKTDYLKLASCSDEADFVEEICSELQDINNVLQQANAHVGYRVRDEIVFYMLNNKKADLLERNTAMDNEIMQKILPRIQGSSSAVKEMLCDLFKIFCSDYSAQQTAGPNLFDQMQKAIDAGAIYPESANKVAFMVRRFDEDGFTSYWL